MLNNMAGFSGFTDEEIFRLKMQGQGLNHGETQLREPVKKALINNSGKRGKPKEKMRTRHTNSRNNAARAKGEPSTSPMKGRTCEAPKEQGKPVEEKVLDENKAEEKPREVEVIMEPERVKEKELSNLEKMQQKQKEMEKINKKNEKMLQHTLQQRYKKTKKETETLKLVQKELSHLDNLLSVDVQILRDKIDDACREYDAARKRYEKAEAEYINAKVNFHHKTEAKDQLTEHLCSIIQENEQRKAKKLAELMAKLEIGDQGVSEETELAEHEDNARESKEGVTPISTVQAAKSQKLQDERSFTKDCDKTENTVCFQVENQSNHTEISDDVDERVEADKESETNVKDDNK